MVLAGGGREALAERVGRAQRRRLRNLTFSLVANDCWGGEAHRVLGLPYRSPFAGLMIMAPCYLRILADLPRALAGEIVPVERSRYDAINRMRPSWGASPYPIGVIEDLDAEVHFLHYPSFGEAVEKWQRRAARVDLENLFVVLTADKSYCTEDTVNAFTALPFEQKLLLSARAYGVPNEVVVDGYSTHAVRLFRRTLAQYDVVEWLNGGSGDLSRPQRLLRRAALAAWADSLPVSM
ncbi:MAG: hypothetical protein JWM71_2481 [Solirubrobacteraceae bacterium]|nr:hypothetical protein [Solirubrobacteraceae bacterium]